MLLQNRRIWEDAETVIIAPQTLASGATVRGTLDLFDKIGAMIKIAVCKADTTQPANAIVVRVRRVLNRGAAIAGGPNMPALFSPSSTITGTVAKTTVDAASVAGGTTLYVAATANIVAGSLIAVWDTALTRLEILRVTAITTNDYVTVDSPLMYTHAAADADNVTGLVDSWAAYIDGGSLIDVSVTYPTGLGSNQIVTAIAQVADYDESRTDPFI